MTDSSAAAIRPGQVSRGLRASGRAPWEHAAPFDSPASILAVSANGSRPYRDAGIGLKNWRRKCPRLTAVATRKRAPLYTRLLGVDGGIVGHGVGDFCDRFE